MWCGIGVHVCMNAVQIHTRYVHSTKFLIYIHVCMYIITHDPYTVAVLCCAGNTLAVQYINCYAN